MPAEFCTIWLLPASWGHSSPLAVPFLFRTRSWTLRALPCLRPLHQQCSVLVMFLPYLGLLLVSFNVTLTKVPFLPTLVKAALPSLSQSLLTTHTVTATGTWLAVCPPLLGRQLLRSELCLKDRGITSTSESTCRHAMPPCWMNAQNVGNARWDLSFRLLF